MSRRRGDHAEEHEAGHERWLVSYADFITLMFAFFTILYATSEKDLSKAKEFEESLKKYMIKAGGMVGGEAQVYQAQNQDTVIEPPINTFRRQKLESTEELGKAEQFIETRFSAEERKAFIQDVGLDDWGIRITLYGGRLFSDGNDKFKEDAVQFVSKLSEVLAESKNKVMIEGHVAANEKGSYRSTWDFSSARAINFLRFVQAKQSLEPSRLSAASFGDSRPVQKQSHPHLNSRIEIVLLNQDLDL